MKRVVLLSLSLMLLCLFASSVYAEVKTDFGGAFRLREEVWDNVVSLGTGVTSTSASNGSGVDRNWFRLRTSFWGKADFTSNMGIYGRLTNEANYHMGQYEPLLQRFSEDEIIVDNLYFDAKNVAGLPVDLRLGRQDFLGPNGFGEGFLLLDGTPGDGSRSFYFNALRATVKVASNHSIDFVYIDDPKTDTFFPSMITGNNNGTAYQDNKRILTASRETAFVAYGKSKITQNLTVEPYYIYKTEGGIGANLNGAIDPAPNAKLKLNTVGARAVYSMDAWKVRGEFATQFGKYDDTLGTKRSGNGGYFWITRNCKETMLKPEFEVGMVYMSGDKPGTAGKVEAWDPLFSRAPAWNELIIYTLINETVNYGYAIPGYWTNMNLYKASAKLNFTPSTNLVLAYQYIQAAQSLNITGASAMFASTGSKDRGHLPTAVLSHKFSNKLDGFLQYEVFVPGDYYNSNARNATFFRWQLMYKI